MMDSAQADAESARAEEPAALLRPAVEAAGGTLLGARATQVRRDRRGRVMARYATTVRWGDGQVRTETFGSVDAPDEATPDLAVVADDAGNQVGVWRYPHDPFLPGLPHVAYPDAAAKLLRTMGFKVNRAAVTPLVYRPGVRAVLRLAWKTGEVFVKVLPPHHAARVRTTHRRIGQKVPVPRMAGWSDELGICVFEALAGRTLSRALVDGGQVPSPDALGQVLDALADVSVERRPIDRNVALRTHASLLGRVLPGAAGTADAVADAARVVLSPTRTVHGDFYEAQVLVLHGTVSGLLDIDDMRPGHPAEDWANLIGHLQVLADVRPVAARRITGYRLRAEAMALDHANPDDLNRAVVGVLLGMATVPYLRQENGWKERCDRWLGFAAARAGIMPDRDERSLIHPSPGPH